MDQMYLIINNIVNNNLKSIWKKFSQQQTANLNTNILYHEADTAATVNNIKEMKRKRNPLTKFLYF